VFDVFGRGEALRASEVLSAFRIAIEERVVYSGRCTVTKLINQGESTRCEALLGDTGVHVDALPAATREDFEKFLSSWLMPYQMSSAFKVALADFEILLMQLRGWLQQVEIKQASLNGGASEARTHEAFETIAPKVIATIASQHERFEELFDAVPRDQRGVYSNYARIKLSPYFLCTPFGDRTYHKPLGFAGDYEMMNMIHRNQPEGNGLYCSLMHMLLVRQWPAESVRNRIAHLKGSIINETARAVRSGRRARILNLGCGPAWEIQEFMAEHALSDRADFVLLDFSEETLTHVGGRLRELTRTHGRRTGIETRQISVQHLLRSALQRRAAPAEKYDMIYCAGLFDYLSDATCRALVALFCDWLEKDGLLAVANMNNSKPFQHFIESILDWHLIYRSAEQMRNWRTPCVAEQAVVRIEPTTVNLFLEIRTPG